MDKNKSKDFNMHSAMHNLVAQQITFSIANPRLDDLFNMEFGPTDYIEKADGIYYILSPNEYDRFLDFTFSHGFDPNTDINQVESVDEMSTTSGAGAYNPSLHASKKKRNPFMEKSDFYESVLSGYKELTGFKPGHTPDKGGFQYKELWAEDACWDGYQQIGMKDKGGKQVPNCVPIKEDNLDELDVNDPILMKLRAKKDQPTKSNLSNPNQSKINLLLKKRAEIERDMEQEAEPEGGPIADRYGDVLNRIDSAIAKLKRHGEWGPETNPYMDKGEIDRRAAMMKEDINENYARFRNETKTRSESEQYHQAVKAVKKKVQEIGKLYTYLERMQLELSETESGLKKKKYTEMAIAKIKEEVKQLNKKIRKLK